MKSYCPYQCTDMWLLIKANFALLSQLCYEEISTILSKCDRKMFVSKINNPHCHVWPSLLAACTWRRIRSIQQKWWRMTLLVVGGGGVCLVLLGGICGAPVGAGMLGASSPALMLHVSGWWCTAYPHHFPCASYETEVSEHGHPAEMNFAVLKRKKLQNIVMSHVMPQFEFEFEFLSQQL